MATRLGKFELPNRLIKEEETATDKFAKFIADPFETGYGHTVGNAFRRVLLSSIEGAAISSVKMDGVQHEFQSVDGVVEDVDARGTAMATESRDGGHASAFGQTRKKGDFERRDWFSELGFPRV